MFVQAYEGRTNNNLELDDFRISSESSITQLLAREKDKYGEYTEILPSIDFVLTAGVLHCDHSVR